MSEFKFTELQEKWLKALESGEYKQLRGALHDGEAFCCLGVACVVAGIPGVCSDTHSTHFRFDDEYEVAPDSVVKALKLRGSLADPPPEAKYVIADRPYTDLAQANDTGVSFAEIAAFVRANPEKVFTGGAE